MGNGKLFIIIGIMFGGLAWLMDAVVDWLFFSRGTFWEALITDVPAHEVYIRSITVAALLVFGIVVSAATSKQRQAERKAAESERFLQDLFDAIQYGISVRDREFTLIRTNKWEARKYPSQMPLVGKKCYRVFQQRSSPCPWCPSVKAMETGKPHTAIVPYHPEENPTGWIELSAFPLWDAGGNIVGAIEHAKDITERKRMEAALLESEERFRATFEQAAVGIAHVDANGRFLRINQRYCDIVGYTREQMLQRTFQDITHPDDLEAGRSFTSRLLGGEIGSCSYEKRYYHKNGSTVWVNLTGALVREPSGSPEYFIAVAQDITARKEAERKVIENERFLQRVFDSIQDAISVRDRQLNVVRTNQWLEKKYASEMPLVGRKCYEVFQKRPSVCPWCPSVRAMETREPHRALAPYPSAENPTGWYELSAFPLEDTDGNVIGVVEHGKDITERRRAERELHESREKYRSIFEHSPEMIVLIDLQGTLIDSNHKAEELTGYGRDDLVGMHFSRLPFWSEDTKLRLAETFSRRLRGEEIAPYELDFTRRDGGTMTCRVQGALLGDAEGAATGVLMILSDVTEQRQAEDALRESKEKFRNIFQSSPLGMHMYELQPDGRLIFVDANPAADKILGLDIHQFVGETIEEAFPFSVQTEIPERYRAAARDGTPWSQEQVPYRDKELERAFDVHAFQTSPGKMVTMFSEVTGRRQAEERLRRMEAQLAHVARLSTLGELVAGIAHEVSQPLYCVVNFARATRNVLTAEGEPNLKDLREWNEEIGLAARRAGQIITRLRDFVRRRELQHARVRVNEVVRESVELVAFEARRRGVSVRLDLSEEATMADVDRVQIQQVLVNLLRNAYEALEGVPSGERDVTVRTVVVEPWVEVSVADRGPGLPGDALKIFDAFVTTKPDGLGMGLAISRTIVDAHQGRLWATPNRAGGTTFRFTLPVAKEGRSDGGQADGLRR